MQLYFELVNIGIHLYTMHRKTCTAECHFFAYMEVYLYCPIGEFSQFYVSLFTESNTVLQLAYKVDVFTSRHDSVSNSGVVVER